MKPFNFTQSRSFEKLKKLANQHFDLNSAFSQDPNRFEKFHLEWNDFLFDYSKNHLDQEIFNSLIDLARESDLEEYRSQLFKGEKINKTEKRAVLHSALRSFNKDRWNVDGEDVYPLIENERIKMQNFSDKVRNGHWLGSTGKAIKNIVNIGIGGSDLGPAMVCEALWKSDQILNVYFVSNVDGAQVSKVLSKLDPEETMFVVVSKTFTTQETMQNAHTAKRWLDESIGSGAIGDHFVAVSTNKEGVKDFGIKPENMFVFWNWVGGRFSMWGVVGLSICLQLGYEQFEAFLKGAEAMDLHFEDAPLEKNFPVINALIGVWNTTFKGFSSLGVIPYSQRMEKLPAYLQQGEMESNGKSVDRDGNEVNYQTCPVIWGEPGTNGQHAFFQHLHQGTLVSPIEFIVALHDVERLEDHQSKLYANCVAQAEALMKGRKEDDVRFEMEKGGKSVEEIQTALPHRVFKGNRPSSMIVLNELTPYALGSLIAMYEHKIFVQGVIWNLFSFDQWGVELGKVLAKNVLTELEGGDRNAHDSSTTALIERFLSKKGM